MSDDARLYASLVGPFLDKYCRIPGARDETEARLMCNADPKFQKLWCSMYTLDEVREHIKKYGGEIIVIKELMYDDNVINRYRATGALS